MPIIPRKTRPGQVFLHFTRIQRKACGGELLPGGEKGLDLHGVGPAPCITPLRTDSRGMRDDRANARSFFSRKRSWLMIRFQYHRPDPARHHDDHVKGQKSRQSQQNIPDDPPPEGSSFLFSFRHNVHLVSRTPAFYINSVCLSPNHYTVTDALFQRFPKNS